ncbi:L,D-transpeptidase [Priestia megaterium]|uniref:L,D-transpeptidase n=1 Tax=Priestia megaterium TaxID=1404 RepID=UPI0026C5E711
MLIVALCGVNEGKTEAASKPANQDLIIINKYYNKLAYFHNGYIEIVDPVATGKTWDKTPVGFFKVVNKIKNRPYYTGHIPGGDPRNPLGKRWLGLNVTVRMVVIHTAFTKITMKAVLENTLVKVNCIRKEKD